MGVGDEFKFYHYESDNGNTYIVKLSTLIAEKGTFNEASSALELPAWPYNTKNMRHVTGVSDTGKRLRLPLASNADALYISGGSVSLHGTTFKIEGAIGERRPASAIGG